MNSSCGSFLGGCIYIVILDCIEVGIYVIVVVMIGGILLLKMDLYVGWEIMVIVFEKLW